MVGQWNAMPLLATVLPKEGHRLCLSLESPPIYGCFCIATPAYLPGPTGLVEWTLKKKKEKTWNFL